MSSFLTDRIDVDGSVNSDGTFDENIAAKILAKEMAMNEFAAARRAQVNGDVTRYIESIRRWLSDNDLAPEDIGTSNDELEMIIENGHFSEARRSLRQLERLKKRRRIAYFWEAIREFGPQTWKKHRYGTGPLRLLLALCDLPIRSRSFYRSTAVSHISQIRNSVGTSASRRREDKLADLVLEVSCLED